MAPAITLGRYQFENAVAEIAAQLIWLGESENHTAVDACSNVVHI